MSDSRLPTSKPFKKLSSNIVWSSPWYHVRRDELLLPDGRPGVYNIIEHPGAVWILPVTTTGEIVLVYHYRYTVDDWCWEIPAGGVQPGKTLAETAENELWEEVGGQAQAIAFAGRFYTANGISKEIANIFLATGVELGLTDHEPAEIMEVHSKPIREVLRMARANEISDGPSALAILLCEQKLLEMAEQLASNSITDGG